MSRDNGQKNTYIINKLQLQNRSLTFIPKKCLILLLSATSILSRSPKAYNTTASLEKLTYTGCVDFGKFQDSFGRLSWSQKDSNHLGLKLKVLKKHEKKQFRRVENVTMGEADFNQFMRLRKQLVNAAENFAREESFSLVLIPT